MNQITAAAIERRARATTDSAERAGLRAALRVGGFEGIEPDAPRGYIDLALSTARAWNPAYLSPRELDALIAAREAALGGHPF